MATILSNCNVVDVDNGTIIKNSSVLIDGNKIKEVPAESKSSEARVLDLKGLYILPGLIDSHINLTHPVKHDQSEGETVLDCYRIAHDGLQAGVTTIRSVGEKDRVDIALKKKINEGVLEGPRIAAGGKGLAATSANALREGHSTADGPEEFLKAARTELVFGADHLKIYATAGILSNFSKSLMTRAEVESVVSVVNAKGTYVAAHAGGSEAIIMLAESGVKSIEHAYDLDQDGARMMRKMNCYLVPTLGVTRSPERFEKVGFPRSVIERIESFREIHLESIRRAHREGITIATGSDYRLGDTVSGTIPTIREMECLTEAGLSPLEVIQATTLRGAELCGMAGKVGVIKPSAFADFVGMPENPLANLKSLEHISFVMKDGNVIRQSQIET